MILKKEKLDIDLLTDSEITISDIREISNKIMENLDTITIKLEKGETVDSNAVRIDYDLFVTLLKFIQLLHARMEYYERTHWLK